MKKIFRFSFLAAIFEIATTDITNAQSEPNIQQATEQRQQSFAERNNLPQFDCEQKAIMGARKVTIIVPNDSTIVWANANMYKENGARRGIEVTIKTEFELKKSDLGSALWIMGPVVSYSHWKKFGISVKKLRRGFKIGKLSFREPSYGFTCTSPPDTYPFRLVISGNSLEAYEQTANNPSFGFEYIVVNNAIPEFIGNGSQITNLNVLKKSLYTPIVSKYFIWSWVKSVDVVLSSITE